MAEGGAEEPAAAKPEDEAKPEENPEDKPEDSKKDKEEEEEAKPEPPPPRERVYYADWIRASSIMLVIFVHVLVNSFDASGLDPEEVPTVQ